MRAWVVVLAARGNCVSGARGTAAVNGLFRSIALLELGHALGLRHNFAGSLDRNNYPDGYFNLEKRTPLPSYLDYDDKSLGGNGDGDITGNEAQRFGRDLAAAREERLLAGSGTVSFLEYLIELERALGISGMF